MDKDEVLERIEAAGKELCEAHGYLLTNDVNERSITHQLAVCLKSQFVEWDVDCEYNRDGMDPKKIYEILDQGTADIFDTTAKTAYPDVIIYERGTKKNLVVIEAKKNIGSDENGAEKDLKKLRAYRKDLGYEHAVYVNLVTNELRVRPTLVTD
jgi:hypothetical protein